MDKPCPLCRAVHRPATRSSQPHVGMWGNLPASPSQVSPPVRLRPQQFEKKNASIFLPTTTNTLRTRAEPCPRVQPPTRVHCRLPTQPNHTAPGPRRQVGPARPRTTWAAASRPQPSPGPARNLHPTTPRPSLPVPTCRPGPRQRHRAMPPGHLPPWPRCHPRRGTRASAPPFKTRQRRGGRESLVATTL